MPWLFIPLLIVFAIIFHIATAPVEWYSTGPSANLSFTAPLDPAVVKNRSALEKILQDSQQESLHAAALYAIFDIDPVEGCKVGFALNNAGKLTGNDRNIFEMGLDKAITIENLPHIDATELQKLASSDHDMELRICSDLSG